MGNVEDDDPSVTGQFYVNSNIDSDYDGYQQAWRILGIYVDCRNYINNNNNNNNNYVNHACQRYLVWAAYIDLQYEGGAIGEYQFYNRTERTYDDTTCTSATTTTTGSNNQRCAKMDCHDTTSSGTWSLMGVYKEPYYASEFFEQLFKHLGYCLWDSSTYNFMQNSYNMWPDSSGCVASATLNPITNQPYYIDLRPGPNLTLALYSDSTCYHEYDVASDDDTLNLDAILQNAGYLSSEQLRQFNDAMMPFYHCQPCRAYDLENVDGSLYGGDNNNNADASNDPNYPKYLCLDIAGYSNVNQCMKFRTKTQMLPMTRKDLHVATLQGAITHLQFYASTAAQQQQLTLSSSYHSIYFQPSLNESDTSAGTYVVLSMAILLMVGSIYYCYSVFRWVLKKDAKQNSV